MADDNIVWSTGLRWLNRLLARLFGGVAEEDQ